MSCMMDIKYLIQWCSENWTQSHAVFVLSMVTYAQALSVETVGSGTKTSASMVLLN